MYKRQSTSRGRAKARHCVLALLLWFGASWIYSTTTYAASSAAEGGASTRTTSDRIDLVGTSEAMGLEGIVGGPYIYQDNVEAAACRDPAALAFIAFFPGSLTWGPIEFASEIGTYIADLFLKHCAPVLNIPPPIAVDPTIRGADNKLCYHDFNGRPAESADYENMLGISLPRELLFFGTPWPDSWGPFGDPEVYHFNTGASVELSAPGEGVMVGGQQKWRVGVGANSAVWTASTRLSILDILWLPIPGPFTVNDQQSKRVKWELAKAMAGNLLQDIAIDYGLGRIDDASQSLSWPISWTTAINRQVQPITVWDVHPPEVYFADSVLQSPDGKTVEIVAFSPGGAHLADHRGHIRNLVLASDECDRTVTVFGRDMPQFFKVDVPYNVTWTVRDRGPVRSGGVHEVTKLMTIVAKDIHPPDINPPDHRVILSSQSQTQVDIGWPQVFDAVDLNPMIFNDAPASFPQGVTEITWYARDQSGNESRRVIQRVNVKLGNSPPQAIPRTGAATLETRTWEEVEVELEGFDPDPNDFVNFEITRSPEDGFFHAPLYPAFVEDYRVESNATFDELEVRCATQSGPWQAEFPYVAEFVDVADDGTTYIVDRGDMFCQASSGHLDSHERLAVFDAEGQLKRRPDGTPLAVSADPDGIWIDKANGRIYVTDAQSSGLSRTTVYDLELNQIIAFRTDVARPPAGENHMTGAVQAVADFSSNVMYVTNRTTIRAYYSDRLVEGGLSNEPVHLGTIALHGAGGYRDLDVDSEGNLYASHFGRHRIYKFSPSTFNEAGDFVPGQLIGWLGKCVGQLQETEQPVCDLATQSSIGFTCTDALCDTGNPGTGSGPGQLSRPKGLALSPDDVLYVVDYENDRIQRFTPDGYWAGEAKSTCEGVCFVLGAFNNPEDITVNSEHFYILDRQTNLLHVSETTPIEIRDGLHATVKYQSGYFFEGMDSFDYRVNDGLVNSPPARVDIRVLHGRRPPEGAVDLDLVTDEDSPLPLPFTGFDPDGDPVTFLISTPPTKGEARLANGSWFYFPDANSNGFDSFQYQLTDTNGASEPATVNVTVIPNFDVPIIDVPSIDVAGRGFPWQLKADFLDPDDNETHTARVDWGDGTSATDVPISQDNEEGPFLNHGRGRGTLTGRHTYSAAQNRQVTACVTDRDLLEGCTTLSVEVKPMVDLALFNTLAETIEDASGDPGWEVDDVLDFTLTVANLAPDGWSGLNATNVEVEDTLAPEVQFISAATSTGLCRPEGRGFQCSMNDLAPGAEAEINVRVKLTQGGDMLTLTDARARADQREVANGSNAQRIVASVAGGAPPPPPSGCQPGGLCLQDGLFRVEMDWRTAEGDQGSGTPVHGSNDSGLFWFFADTNWEMLVKVLDGCGINGRHWVFAASTTNVGYTMTIENTQSGAVATYVNQPGTAAPAIIDIDTLDGCGSNLTGEEQQLTDGLAASGSALTQQARIAKVKEQHQQTMTRWLDQLIATDAPMNASCLPGGTTLCLDNSRFEVVVDWRTSGGETGSGRVVPLSTSDSGLFWFFQDSNWEMLVKILDGCGINNRHWVFAAATTNVEFTMTVTDTLTGEQASYLNPQGNAADAIIDIDALSGCN